MARPLVKPSSVISNLQVQALMARQERAKTDALFVSMGEGVIATDQDGRIIKANKAAQELLGYKQSELLGRWLPKRIKSVSESGKPIGLLDQAITKVFMTGQAVSERTFYQRKDGSIMPVQLNAAPILIKNKPTGAIQIFRDITAEIEADKLKTEFISLASHQLRTPLAAVQTYTNMFLQGYVGEIDDVQRSFLKTILAASERMNDLISTLLNISRIEAGNLMINRSQVSLDKMLREISAELLPQAAEKRIALQVTCDQPTTVITDRVLVHEVVSNLLTNAVKYTPDQGNVDARLMVEGRRVIFTVTDTGYGIPKTDQSRIFTKFYRASNILNKDTTGTGLGLYLIKSIAERLDGDVWFKSEEDKGTIFYFSIPYKPAKVKSKISV